MIATGVISLDQAYGHIDFRTLVLLFGMMVLKKGQPPFMLPYQLPLFTFVVIMLICTLAALMGIRRVYKVEPAMVFRG